MVVKVVAGDELAGALEEVPFIYALPIKPPGKPEEILERRVVVAHNAQVI